MIRHARPADHAVIAAIVAAAFGRDDEAALVARLRAEEDHRKAHHPISHHEAEKIGAW